MESQDHTIAKTQTLQLMNVKRRPSNVELLLPGVTATREEGVEDGEGSQATGADGGWRGRVCGSADHNHNHHNYHNYSLHHNHHHYYHNHNIHNNHNRQRALPGGVEIHRRWLLPDCDRPVSKYNTHRF